MSRALLALALGLALGGSPLQWASSFVEVMLSATQDSGSQENPNGGPTSDYGSTWDPDG
jgi:hypothetical protein